MFTFSNCLSLTRAPLALLFIWGTPLLRLWAVILAMLTDSIDGFVARRSHTATRLGAILDPVMDKLFVYCCLAALFYDQQILLWQAGAMLSRDAALIFFAIYLTAMRKWKNYCYRSILWGKISTAMQFLVLITLTLNIHVPSSFYFVFFAIGIFALYELFTSERGRC